jgi:hypothetical protein
MASLFVDGRRRAAVLGMVVAALVAVGATGSAAARTADPDHDGLASRFERSKTHTDPRKRDTDGDGLGDRRELRRVGTNPRRRDTDRDGASDGREVRRGTDPLRRPRRARPRAPSSPSTVAVPGRPVARPAPPAAPPPRPGEPPPRPEEPPWPSVPAPATCTREVTPETFASAYGAAPADAVLCLASGSYGTFRGSLRSAPVTLRPQDGQSPAMSLSFNPASNITIDGLVLDEVELADARTRNITVRNSRINGQTTFRTGQLADANVLFDANVHRDWDKCSSCAEGRVWLPESSGRPSGVTIQNSEFSGGLSDGIQNGSNGTRIIGNEFHRLESGSAGGVHADAIQLYGSSNTVIRGNWFHDLPDGVGIVMAADGADHERIEDNVIGPGNRRPWLDIFSDDGSLISHNTFVDGACEYNQRCGQISLGSKTGDDAGRGTVIRDNILTGISCCNGPASYGADHNLLHAGSYVGPLTSYAGFRLAPGSPGSAAATDGLDLGARFQ